MTQEKRTETMINTKRKVKAINFLVSFLEVTNKTSPFSLQDTFTHTHKHTQRDGLSIK